MEQMDSRHLDWDSPYLWVCYNNDCTLFKKGWDHMMETVGQLVSYRFMIHPQNGERGVIPAFSHQYLQGQWQTGEPELQRGVSGLMMRSGQVVDARLDVVFFYLFQ